jgi:uncharacterized membrane protein HdeD (DUF308 family)
MNKRPVSVTLVGVLYICAGIAGIVYHFHEFTPHPFEKDVVVAVLVRLAAIVAGAFLLAGKDWARWLAVVWMAFHVVLSAFHSRSELAMHAVFLIVIVYFLSRPQVTQYLRAGPRTNKEHAGS